MLNISPEVKSLLGLGFEDLESMVFEINPEEQELTHIVAILTAYMMKRGLKFKIDHSDDAKGARAILNSKTSVGYRTNIEINGAVNKIVLYCSNDEVDKKNFEDYMGKISFDNHTDSVRPFGFMFENYECPYAVYLLTKNPENI